MFNILKMKNQYFDYEDVIDHNNTSVFFCNGKLNKDIGYVKEGTHFDFLLLNFEKMEIKIYIDNKVHVTSFGLSFDNADTMYEKDDDSELDVSSEEEDDCETSESESTDEESEEETESGSEETESESGSEESEN